MTQTPRDVTTLLQRIDAGDAKAADELLPVIYDELRARAAQLMGMERKDHTLQRTALVHEAYLRLVRPGATFHDRLHFFNAAGLAMRRILIDHANAKRAAKRGGGLREVSLSDIDIPDCATDADPLIDIIALDAALKELAHRSPRQAQVVNLRFFACLKDAQIAEMLEVTEKTVQRDWTTARLWLYDQINR